MINHPIKITSTDHIWFVSEPQPDSLSDYLPKPCSHCQTELTTVLSLPISKVEL